MRLTWRDAGATLVVAALGAMAWAYFSDQNWPVVESPRVLSVVAFLFGVATCATGSRGMMEKESDLAPGERLLRLHGAAAFALMIAGAISGNEMVLIILLCLVGVMWLFATVRHAIAAVPTSA